MDFDGTIVSCRDKQIARLKDGLDTAGQDIDWSAVWRRKRRGLNNDAALAPHRLGTELRDKMKEFWLQNIETEHYIRYDEVLPGVHRALAHLSDRHDLFLISARKNPVLLFQQIDALGLVKHFQKVITVPPENAAQGKAQAFAELALDGYIGDTEADFSAASTSGITSYIVGTGQRSASFLIGQGVPHVYGRFSTVQKVLNA